MAKNQVQLLRLTLQHYDKIGVMLNKMRVAYIAGDLDVLSGAVLHPTIPIDKKDTEFMLFHLAVRRNILMLNRMQPYLKKGNTFFAVGALHLIGKGGLLRLLESQGYKLTRLH